MAVELGTRGLRIAGPGDDMIVSLDSVQGMWTEEQYLTITDHSRRLIEFDDGVVELLPMPTRDHQAISRFLLFAFFAFLQQVGGTVFYAPLRMQVRPGKYREPDLLILRDAQDPRNQNRYWLGADLVVEIVSPDDPERDTKVKVADYAEANVPEYWIVNPLDETITVLTLVEAAYATHGVLRRGERATSRLLAGFDVAVDEVFGAAA